MNKDQSIPDECNPIKLAYNTCFNRDNNNIFLMAIDQKMLHSDSRIIVGTNKPTRGLCKVSPNR